ncbi:MAG: hypothetical protein IH608_04210, partial [Proteobacteria bacterium]|nr:hypothetical protein [Pseudomonadota bacterium]
VRAEAEEVIPWEKYDSWAYDYGGVVEAALRKGIGEVNRVVDKALAALGR